MKNCEEQLLASWILGYNRDHIVEFEKFNFYPEIFSAVKSVKEPNIMAVAKKAKVNVSEVAEILKSHLPFAYDGAYRKLKEEKIKCMLVEIAKNPTRVERKIKAITDEMEKLTVTNVKPPTDLAEAYRLDIEQRKISQPLKYGLRTLDYFTGGIRNKELTVIAARPSIGKTALALQIAYNLAIQENKVFIFSLEMSGPQLTERIACRLTEISHEHLKTPKFLTEDENTHLNQFIGYMEKTQIYLNVVEGVSTLSGVKKYIEFYKPSVVFIDQLSQLKENRRFNSPRERFTYMTNTLKSMAMELDIPIILCAQINRSAQNKKPTLADLKESGSIEEDADNVIMIHQDEESDNETIDMLILIRKQRNGVRDVEIDTVYRKKRFKFDEIDHRG